MIEKAALTSRGIQKLLKSYDWPKSIAEYIWNGFDAGATEVELNFDYESLPFDSVRSIKVTDNGSGISPTQLADKFKPINESEKASSSNPKHHSIPHGRNGRGRLTFFTFAGRAKWRTISRTGGSLKGHEITIKSSSLDDYISNPVTLSDGDAQGTAVFFDDISDLSRHNVSIELIPFLVREFGWFLELNEPNVYTILINGVPLDYSSLQRARDVMFLSVIKGDHKFSVRFVLWADKLNGEYSKYYYINSQGREVWKENTTLNNKGDDFYHSLYIQSAYFDDFQWGYGLLDDELNLGKGRKDEVFKILSQEVSRFLHEKRNPFISEYMDKLVADYEKDGIFPKYDRSLVSQYKKEALETTVKEIYKVQPKVFTTLNFVQKKALIGLLNAILELGADDKLMEVISKVVEMTEEERSELAHVLGYASLSTITKTMNMIYDRFKVVADLKAKIFESSWGADEAAIQSIVEEHYWLFGEQFNLVTAEEPDFEEALRRYLNLLEGDGEVRKPKISHKDKNKEMDIFACRKDVRNDLIENIVVELKHPTVKLGKKELNQIDTYLSVILSEPRFTAENMHWTFILVGNSYDTSGSIERAHESAANHGEKFLVQKNPSNRSKIYVKRWSDIFSDFECRHDFILKKLELNKANLVNEVRTELRKKQMLEDLALEEAMNPSIEPVLQGNSMN